VNISILDRASCSYQSVLQRSAPTSLTCTSGAKREQIDFHFCAGDRLLQ